MTLRTLALFIVGLASASAIAATPYKTESITLLQPDFVLEERISSVDALANYIKAVQSVAGETLASESPTPANGFLVLAVRPGGQSMVWLDLKPALSEPASEQLKAAILAVEPFETRHGVVVFALNASLWEAGPGRGFPNPPEWAKAMEGHDGPFEIGDLVDKVWPGSPGG